MIGPFGRQSEFKCKNLAIRRWDQGKNVRFAECTPGDSLSQAERFTRSQNLPIDPPRITDHLHPAIFCLLL